MNAPILSISRRTRETPFTPMNRDAGVKGYTVYNHMLLPTMFESIEADYHHLKRHVQLWDVAWAKGLAYGFRLDVDVNEPDVFPLAVQGPQADELMARVFGDQVRTIKFFRFSMLSFEGHEMPVARSGYSKQGGFEIYVTGAEIAGPLWERLMQAGEDLQVRAGCPNLIERIEGRLLSYGNDMTRENTPHECGLGRFCDTQTAIGCVGRDALLRVASEGPVRQIRNFSIDGDAVPPCTALWPVFADGERVGRVSSAVWSPDFKTNVALGMIRMTHWKDGTRVEVETPTGMRAATVREKSFT